MMVSDEPRERDDIIRSNRVIMRTGTSRKMRSSEPRRARYSRLYRSGFVSIQSLQRIRKQKPEEETILVKPIEDPSQAWIINGTAGLDEQLTRRDGQQQAPVPWSKRKIKTRLIEDYQKVCAIRTSKAIKTSLWWMVIGG
jgi:hypothetical protein